MIPKLPFLEIVSLAIDYNVNLTRWPFGRNPSRKTDYTFRHDSSTRELNINLLSAAVIIDWLKHISVEPRML
jgi:hypothetical protein